MFCVRVAGEEVEEEEERKGRFERFLSNISFNDLFFHIL